MKETLETMSREELIKIILRGGANESIIDSVRLESAFEKSVQIKEELQILRDSDGPVDTLRMKELVELSKDSNEDLYRLISKSLAIGMY